MCSETPAPVQLGFLVTILPLMSHLSPHPGLGFLVQRGLSISQEPSENTEPQAAVWVGNSLLAQHAQDPKFDPSITNKKKFESSKPA